MVALDQKLKLIKRKKYLWQSLYALYESRELVLDAWKVEYSH